MERLYRKTRYRSKKKFSYHSPVRLSELVDKQARRLGLQTLHRLEIIRQKWPQAAGLYVASNVTPIRLIRKTLRVAVSDATWLTEMTYLTESILERLQILLSGKWVKEIKTVMGESNQVVQPLVERTLSKIRTHPTDEMLDRVGAATASVKDEQLCQSINKAMLACILRLENHPTQRKGKNHKTGKNPYKNSSNG